MHVLANAFALAVEFSGHTAHIYVAVCVREPVKQGQQAVHLKIDPIRLDLLRRAKFAYRSHVAFPFKIAGHFDLPRFDEPTGNFVKSPENTMFSREYMVGDDGLEPPTSSV